MRKVEQNPILTPSSNPTAPGPYRADRFRGGPGPGISRGLCHDAHSADRPFLLRFDCKPSCFETTGAFVREQGE